MDDVEIVARAIYEQSAEGNTVRPWEGLTPSSQRLVENISRAAITALRQPGWCKVEDEPSEGLLISMALRLDHAFCEPPYEFSGFTMGTSPEYRSMRLDEMRKVWEEVVGKGFYRPEKEEQYRSMLAQKSPPPDSGPTG